MNYYVLVFLIGGISHLSFGMDYVSSLASSSTVQSEMQPFKKQLLDAAKKGNIEALRYAMDELGKRGHYPKGHVKNSKDQTALMLALLNGHKECVQALIVEGEAQVSDWDMDGKTSCMYAAYGGSYDCFLIIKNRANLLAVDKKGMTALSYATHPEIAKYLIETFPQLVTMPDKKGVLPLYYATIKFVEVQKENKVDAIKNMKAIIDLLFGIMYPSKSNIA